MSSRLDSLEFKLDLSKRTSKADATPIKRESSITIQRTQSRRTTFQQGKSTYRSIEREQSILNTSTDKDKTSRYGSAQSRRRNSKRSQNQAEKLQGEDAIQEKTQISVKKYYQGTKNYKVAVKIKMIPYEQKLKNAFLSIENLDQKTIVLRNKPDVVKGNNKIQISRDVTQLHKDKVQTFDWVFGENENSEIMAVKFLQEPVQSFLNGYNQSIILYGGPDSGKTHLTIGNLRDPGLIILLLKEVLYHKNEMEDKGANISIKMSLCKYKNDQFNDCIINHGIPLEVHEDSQKQLYLAGVYEVEIKSLLQALRIIKIAQLNLQKYEQSTDKSKNLLKNTNIIFEIKCIKEDEKDIDKKHIISRLKFIKIEKETFAEAINAGSQNSVLAPLNNCFRIISEINLKTRKSNSVPYKSNKLIEYLRDSIGGNSQSYLIGCANPLSEYVSDTEAMIRNLNVGKSITTAPEMMKYSNKMQENYAEVYQKNIQENISGWVDEFIVDQPSQLTRQQQVRLQLIGNILSKIQQIMSKLLINYTEIQESQEQLYTIYYQIIENMSKAYTKCITSSDIKEFYIGKLQSYHIDSFKQLISNYQQTIEFNLNKLYKQKMKAEVWEYKLVQHLKLKDLRESKPDDLQPKDVEKLVQISKQSKKLYQFYNEQVCLSQFDYIRSKKMLNSLFNDINQIKGIQSLNQIPTLQQINSTQFIEVKNKAVSLRSIDDPSQMLEGKSPLGKKINTLQHSRSKMKLTIRGTSQFQNQKDDDSSFEREDSYQEIKSARQKQQKSQFLIMNSINNAENDEQSRQNTIGVSRDNFTQNSEFDIDQQEQKSTGRINIKELEKKYLQQQKKKNKNEVEKTKVIYINNKKIEVKNNKSKKGNKTNQKDQQNSINKSELGVSGQESLQISIEKCQINEQANQAGITLNQLLSQDQSLISQVAAQNITNDNIQQQANQSQFDIFDKHSPKNQILQGQNESNLFSNRPSYYTGVLNNNNSNFQADVITNAQQSQNSSKLDDMQQRIQQHQMNLPYLSQLLDNTTSEQISSQDNTKQTHPMIPSNQISTIIHSSQQNSYFYNSKLNQQSNDDNTRIKHQNGRLDLSQISVSPKLELDDGLLSDIFQKSKLIKSSSRPDILNNNRYSSYQLKIQQEYLTKLPQNIQSLDTTTVGERHNSLGRTKNRNSSIIGSNNQLKQQHLQQPQLNYNVLHKKLSLINLRGQHLYQQNAEESKKSVGYFRTQLKESPNPLPKDYFLELIRRSQLTGKMELINQFKPIKSDNYGSMNNLNTSSVRQNIQNAFQDMATQNSNEQLASNIFQRYENQPEATATLKKSIRQQSSSLTTKTNKSIVETGNSQEPLKLPKQVVTNTTTVRRPILMIKDTFGIKLPNINETLLHRSKYTKFFLKN